MHQFHHSPQLRKFPVQFFYIHLVLSVMALIQSTLLETSESPRLITSPHHLNQLTAAIIFQLVLVLIKDELFIKRMLTTRHQYTRDLILHQKFKN